MAKPVTPFEFATNTNYSTGPDAGTPTKIAPSAGEIDNGFVRDTASVAQHVNWLFGEVEDWLAYLNGLGTDTEFLTTLEDRSWHITGDFIADGQISAEVLVATTSALVAGPLQVNSLTVDAATTLTGNVGLGGTLTVAGVTTLNGDLALGAGDSISLASRIITKRLANNFSTAIVGATGLATSFQDALGVSAWVDVDSSWRAPVMEFEVPNGTVLVDVVVGYTSGTSGGGSSIVLNRTGGGVGTNPKAVTSLGAHITSSGNGTSGATFTGLSEPSMTGTGGYSLVFEPNGTDFASRDRINWVEISYTTTHVDPND